MFRFRRLVSLSEQRKDLTPQFIEYVAKKENLNYEDAVRYLQHLYTNRPEELRKEVSEFVAAKINTGDFLYDVENDTSVKGFNVSPSWVEKHVKDKMNFEIKKTFKKCKCRERY